MRIFDYIESCDAKLYSSALEEVLIGYIDESFTLFETIAPNRTTFSLATNYCKYMLLLREQVILDIRDFESLLYYQLSKYYIYKYQAQYKDGYIQKR